MRTYACLLAVCAACASPSAKSGGGSGGSDGSGSSGGDAGGSGSGDSTSTFAFAVVGDTRPPIPEDTLNYPTPIITKIFQDIAAEQPAPQFVVGTGDYLFSFGLQIQQQLDLYMGARAGFPGAFYPAMGNHECNSFTNSNCASSPTSNMTAFMKTMLAPIGIDKPYYTQTLAAADQSWTAKLVFVACNAWDDTQKTWLDGELAKPTTYTFVVRHEGVDALSGSPCADSDPVIEAHPLTLRVSGHTHTYAHDAAHKQIIVGNGGAPLSSGTNYGYAVVVRNADGTVTVTAYDYMTHAVLDTFTVPATG